MLKRYVINVLLAIDQLGNAMAGGNPDETISSRLGRWAGHRNDPVAVFICRLLDLVDPGHCRDNIERDEDPAKGVQDSPFPGLVLLIIACTIIYVTVKG